MARWLEVLSTPLSTAKVSSTLMLMRCPVAGACMQEEEREEANSCDAVSHLMLPTWTEEEIKSFQSADPDIHQMVFWLETDATPRGCPKDASWRLASLWVQRRYRTLQHGVLYRCWEDIPGGGTGRYLQLVLPANLVNQHIGPQYVGRGAYGGEENLRKSLCPFLLAGSEERGRTMVQEL